MQDRSNGRRGMRRNNEKESETVALNTVNWRRLFSYLRPYWKRMILAIFTLVISTGLGLAFPLVIMQLLTVVTDADSYTPLNILTIVLIGVFLFQSMFTFLQSYLMSFVGEHIVNDLRTSLFEHLQFLSLDFYATGAWAKLCRACQAM